MQVAVLRTLTPSVAFEWTVDAALRKQLKHDGGTVGAINRAGEARRSVLHFGVRAAQQQADPAQVGAATLFHPLRLQ